MKESQANTERGSSPRGVLLSPLQACLIFGILLVVVLAVFHQGFNSPMIYDSEGWIEDKAHIFARGDLREVMSIVSVRPLFMTTLYINYLLHGMEPYYFRVVNAVVPAAAGLALVWLSLLIFGISGPGVGGTDHEKRAVAIFFGLLFVVHPLQSFVVIYIWQREAIMACFFYFTGLAVYIAARSGRFSRVTPAYALASLFFLAGMFSKENLATFPAVLILVELTLFRQGFRQIIKRGGAVAIITALPMLIYFPVTHYLHGTITAQPPGVFSRLVEYYGKSGLTPIQAAMTECRVLFSYLATIVAPFMHWIQFIRAETISTSRWRPPVTLAACGGIIGLVCLGPALVRRKPLHAFGILFFFIAVTPESTLIPPYLSFGYRPIPPMTGLLLILGAGLLRLGQWCGSRIPDRTFRPVAVAVLIVPLVCLGAVSAARAGKWNPLQFRTEAYLQLPPISERFQTAPYLDIITNVSAQLIYSGDHARAIEVLAKAGAASCPGAVSEGMKAYRRAIKINPRHARAYNNLGAGLEHSGDLQGALKLYETAVEIDPYLAAAHYRKALRVDPSYAALHFGLATVLKQKGDMQGAAENYAKAAKLDPRSSLIHYNLARTLEKGGNLPAAVQNYGRAAQLQPASAEIHFNLANALVKSGDFSGSIESCKKALERKPNYADAHTNMGIALISSGKFSAAIESFKKAVAMDKGNPEIYYGMGVAPAELGRRREAAENLRRALTVGPNHVGAKRALEILMKENVRPSERLPRME